MTGQAKVFDQGSPIAVNDEPRTLTAVLVKRMRDLIEKGELAPGSKLPPERQLAQTLKVSRASVRQAVKALEAQGIIVSRVGVGNFITSGLSELNLLSGPFQFAIRMNNIPRVKLYEVRQIVEVHLVGLTAERVGEQELSKIRRELEEMHQNRQNPRAMAGSDYRFHMEIIRACGNEIFELLFEPVSKVLFEDLTERMHLFDPEPVLRLHRAIYEAIEKKDSERAMKAMKEHLQVGYRMFFGSDAESATKTGA